MVLRTDNTTVAGTKLETSKAGGRPGVIDWEAQYTENLERRSPFPEYVWDDTDI
jgi:hypothetical protein